MELLEEKLDEKNEKILSKLDNAIGISQNKQILRDIIKYSRIMKEHKCNIEFENYNIVIRNESAYNLYEDLISVIAEIYYKNQITLNKGVYYMTREELWFDKFEPKKIKEGIIVFDLKTHRRDYEEFKKQFEKVLFAVPTKSFIILEDSFMEGELNAVLSDYATWGMKIDRISEDEKCRYIRNFIEKNKLVCSEDIIREITNNPFYKIKNDLVNILVSCKANNTKDVSKVVKKQIRNQNRIVKPKKNAMDELDKLIGLEDVKTQIKKIVNYIKVSKNKSNRPMLHMCFTGNPGTGKTTVARIVGKIFSEENILSENNIFVEAQRGDLIGEFVGQTAPRTERVIKRALGGVLFIDEAYSISSYIQDEVGGDYGAECIATLIKEMEDNRDNLCVILAGYTKEMERMLKVNPGFQSRIQFIIEFPDYSSEELLEIFTELCKKEKYKISVATRKELLNHFEIARKEKRFSNGRYARNIFEKIKIEQAYRITSEKGITEKDKNLIKKCDLDKVIGSLKKEEVKKMKIGF